MQINDCGTAIANYSAVIPGGIVVFFPSYAFLNQVVEQWKETAIFGRIQKRKKIFMEISSFGNKEADNVLGQYSKTILDSGAAILFAVVGGSLSEGINFSDELGRAVIMVGVPFANIMAPEIQEKMKYLDKDSVVYI
jgi:chromosome transmission fidelity protein 1